MEIPGASEFIDRGNIPNGLLLLMGPAGAGKTMYVRQFVSDGLVSGNYCIFISSSLSVKQFKELFSGIDRIENLKFINPSLLSSSKKDIALKLSSALADVRNAIGKDVPVRIVVDSATHLLLVCGEKELLKFIVALSALLKGSPQATAVCTLARPDQKLYDTLSSLAEGILEMKLEDKDERIQRSIRLLSVKGLHHEPVWINFTISENGSIVFGESSSLPAMTCTLCGKSIVGTPLVYSDFVFDSKTCMETYEKFASAYGSSMHQTGLPSQAFNVSFFFVDIVGLSDPSLSVTKQVQKIQVLNKLLGSCDAFKITPKEKKIILPTGDGMAIGFLLNPELPLLLAIEFHKKLRVYNRGKGAEDQVGVRIGLGTGPVYTVTDMNDVENVWGPGIILARRVMDAGDNGHILVADKLAEELVALKDEYRAFIRPICHVYEIKHGQRITLYSAYSHEFGNPELPSKVPRIQ